MRVSKKEIQSRSGRSVTAALVIGLGLSILTGCASTRGARTMDAETTGRAQDAAVRARQKGVLVEASAGNTTLNDYGELVYRGMKLENTQFDYPITINSRVEYWIDYFNGRGRGHFARYLERSELFIPFIRPLLMQNGLPQDLVYLAMIESGFNNHAASHAKAVGPWQFISATGKRYGLMVNWWVDERRDTQKSTLAAVGYLRDLYSIFQSWELAAAAYNAGESKVARAIRRYGVKDFWALSRHKFFRPETRDYVPKIIAAAIVAKNRTQFGFPASAIRPGQNEAIAGDGEVVRVESEREEKAKGVMPEGETIQSILAEEEEDRKAAADGSDYENSPTAAPTLGPSELVTEGAAEFVPMARSIPTPKVSKKGELTGEVLAEFEVQSPADLLQIARAAGLSYATVKALNPEVLRWCTPPSVGTYRIKLPVSSKDQFLATYNHPAYVRKVKFLTHKVRSGDTLAGIARRFGIRVDPIADLNGVSPRHPLRAGTTVVLPMPNDRSRSLASLEVLDPPSRSRRRYRSSRRSNRSESRYRVSTKSRESARRQGSRLNGS